MEQVESTSYKSLHYIDCHEEHDIYAGTVQGNYE